MRVDEFEVEEVMTESEDLLVLTLGFQSPSDPLDALHFACGRHMERDAPAAAESLLYIERTDQSLACDGRDVLSLTGHSDHIELCLSEEGARLLDLSTCCRFRFSSRPELLPVASEQLAAMARAGQDCIRPFGGGRDNRYA